MPDLNRVSPVLAGLEAPGFDRLSALVAELRFMTDDPSFRMTAEDVVRRIAAECAFVDERGGVGIRMKPAVEIVRQYGEQFREGPPARHPRRKAAAVRPARQPALLFPMTSGRTKPKAPGG